MAAHRYWRVNLVQAYDGGSTVELSEFWLLFNGSRVDAGATLTSDVAPVSGLLSNLSDNNTATGAVLTVGTVLQWDFGGSPSDADDIRLGSADAPGRFPFNYTMQWSDDGSSWTDVSPLTWAPWAPKWPGQRAMTSYFNPAGWNPSSKGLGNTHVEFSDITLAFRPSASGSGTISGRNKRSDGVRQFEIEASGVGNGFYVGVRTPDTTGLMGSVDGAGVGYLGNTGQKYLGGTLSAYGSTFSVGDVIGVVVDFSTGSVTFYKNGVSQGVAAVLGAGKTLVPAQEENVGNVRQYRIRENGFTYPVVGAEPWVPVTAIERTAFGGVIDIATMRNGGHSLGYETTRLVQTTGGRPNYLFDPAARGRIVGTVKRKDTPDNVPLSRRVRLYRDRDGMLIAETWSDAAGNYQFDYIEENESYTAIAHDHTYFYRAVAADNLSLANGTLELIP